MGTEPKLLNLLLSYAAGHIGEISQEVLWTVYGYGYRALGWYVLLMMAIFMCNGVNLAFWQGIRDKGQGELPEPLASDTSDT